jgi:hypothetical protein
MPVGLRVKSSPDQTCPSASPQARFSPSRSSTGPLMRVTPTSENSLPKPEPSP